MVRIDKAGVPVKQVWNTHSDLLAVHQGDGWFYAAGDVTDAYGGNAAVEMLQRGGVFLKPNVVVVYDRVATASGTTQVWQMASPSRPVISGNKATISGTHSMTMQRLAPASGTSAVVDLAGVTGYRGGYRLQTTVPAGDTRFLHVFSIDGAVTSASAPNDSTVNLSLANGQTATVAFNRDVVGAQLTYDGAAINLGAGVDDLPE